MKTDDRLIPVNIFNIYPYADAQQGFGSSQNFLVFLKGEEEKVVPITIGHFEGQALAMALRKIKLPRPLPHNLLQDLLEKMDARVHKLVIHTLKDEVFHAYLLVQAQGEPFYLDCRPSDGMILATLLGTPIFMSPEVMAEAGRVLEVSEPGETPEGEEAPMLQITTSEDSVRITPARGSEEEKMPPRPQAQTPGEEDMSELDRLKAQLDWLIAQEAYEQAAKVRDQIEKLEKE